MAIGRAIRVLATLLVTPTASQRSERDQQGGQDAKAPRTRHGQAVQLLFGVES